MCVNTIAKSENGSKQRISISHSTKSLFLRNNNVSRAKFPKVFVERRAITAEPVRSSPLNWIPAVPERNRISREEISIDRLDAAPISRRHTCLEERNRRILGRRFGTVTPGNSFVLIAGFAWAIDSIYARTKSYASSTTRRGSRSPICQYKHRPRWRTSKGNCPQRRHRLARTCIRVTIRCNLIRDLASRWVNIITCPT